ncbi:MAG: hypothetical protein RLZ86_1393 [Actinomycetota bacterium]
MTSSLLEPDDLERFTTEPSPLPASEWDFSEIPLPESDPEDDSDLVCVGADLRPATLVSAYSNGFFPMHVGGRRKEIGWFSPDPRGVIPIGGLHVSRSLRKHTRRFRCTVDAAFERVMRECGDERRPHGWIDDAFVDAYTEMHRLGRAHSIEVWQGDQLVGGLYGVRIGRLFAGESMFHRVTDASKVALVATMEALTTLDFLVFDVQWTTPHLRSLGAIDLPRSRYLDMIRRAVPAAQRGNTAVPPTD